MARKLIGMRLESRIGGVITGGAIMETEAYLGCQDPASHAYRGRLNRSNRSIYSRPGTWYVYLSYGMHWCLNLVTGPPGEGAAVLIRGMIPDTGVATMIARRVAGRTERSTSAKSVLPQKLVDGPGKLAQALGIDSGLDGVVMLRSAVRIISRHHLKDGEIEATPRIGISKAADWPLRFVWRGSGSDRAR